MKRFLRCFYLSIVLVMFSGFNLSAAATASAVKPVKYVFLFIGDGMSLPQRMLVREYCRRTGRPDLRINQLAVNGFSSTHAHNALITDSAASGTALACGEKTNCGVIGMTPQNQPVTSVAEVAKKEGRSVGIITSVSIDHATPAAFYAHNPSRGNYYAIGLDLTDSGFDFFGGGLFLKPDGKKGNLYAVAAAKGYRVTRDRAGFNAIAPDPNQKILALCPVSYAIDNKAEMVPLAELTAKAIRLLDNPKGFFMMVEGGRIDWACHANDASTAIGEVLAFDDAVKVADDFARKHPQETLIVVTGDHETGALTLGFAGTAYSSYLELLQHQKTSFEQFGRITRNLYRSGKKSFEDVKPLITQYFGLKFTGEKSDRMVLTAEEVARINDAFGRSVAGKKDKTGQSAILYGSYDPLTVTLTHILANKSGLGWNSYAHTALPVWTSADGVNAEMFAGMTDNTDIGKRLKQIVAQPAAK